MNKFYKLLSENEKIIRACTIVFTFYCAFKVGTSWDEKYYHLIGKINLDYLLSLGQIDQSFDQKYRYSTLYWSLSSLFSQIAPKKYSIEMHHIINSVFGLITIVGVSHVVKKLFNKTIANISCVFLFLIPFFFGHFAINNKDTIIAFAHVWIVYYLIKYSVKNFDNKSRLLLILKISILSALGTGIQLLFMGSLIPIIIIFFVYLFLFKDEKFRKIFLDIVIYIIFFYFTLVLFWVDAHSNILTLPLSFFIKTLSLDVGWAFNLTNGEYSLSKEVPNYYLLLNYLYKLPEFIIFLYLISLPIILIKIKKLKDSFNNFSKKILFILGMLIFPNIVVVLIKYPIYDGLRLFLWVTPYLVLIPAISLFVILDNKNIFFKSLKIITIFLVIFHLYNFIKITPYHYTFLNFFAGDLDKRYKKFENDYWSVSLKELIFSSNLKGKKIKYYSCGVNASIAKTYMRQKYKNAEYTDKINANYIIMTNRTLYSEKNQSISNCYDEFDYENIAEVKRHGLILSAIKKVK